MARLPRGLMMVDWKLKNMEIVDMLSMGRVTHSGLQVVIYLLRLNSNVNNYMVILKIEYLFFLFFKI